MLLPPPFVDPTATTLPPPKRLGKCEGYEFACNDPSTWTVEATRERDEWEACEACCRLVMIYSDAEAVDAYGVKRDREYRQYKDPLYSTWASLIQRCCNPTNGRYASYGGRGISVCVQWRASFLEFRDAVGPRPSDEHTLDRIDNNGNYEPGNVRWATRAEQSSNMRSNRSLTLNGITRTVAEWSRALGLASNVITTRLSRGWSVERALSPERHDEQRLTLDGVTRSISGWAEYAGVDPKTITRRLQVGWSLKDALTEPPRSRKGANDAIVFAGATAEDDVGNRLVIPR